LKDAPTKLRTAVSARRQTAFQASRPGKEVNVRSRAVLEQGQQLVLGAVEAAHAGVGLRPNDEVEGLEAELHRRGVDGRVSAPVDESAENAAIAEAGKDRRYRGLIEGEEFAPQAG
jgi:hypothetical protein